jgi:LysM repeat protein
MKDSFRPQVTDDDEDRSYSPKRRRIGFGDNKSLQILLGILLVLIFAGGILYFLGRQPTGDETNLLQLKLTAMEQKIAELEKNLLDLQGKIGTSGSDVTLLNRVDVLAQKIEALERQKQPAVGLKAKASVPSKPVGATEKQYHTVKKGETLFGIGKKYKISVEELLKLNNLSSGQKLRIGQKLLISTKR